MSRTLAFLALAALPSTAGAQAQDGCRMGLANYADLDEVAEIEFTPAAGATVSNSFRMLLDNDVVLDGIVMWTQGVSRPHGMLMHKCPEGDVTGEELAACTVWQGVIYTSDENGNISLLPAEGAGAARTLILPDLAPSLAMSRTEGKTVFSALPYDVFALKGCQE